MPLLLDDCLCDEAEADPVGRPDDVDTLAEVLEAWPFQDVEEGLFEELDTVTWADEVVCGAEEVEPFPLEALTLTGLL